MTRFRDTPQRWYRDVHITKYCKTCGVPVRYKINTSRVLLDYCHVHRRAVANKIWNDWFNSITPEQQEERKKKVYTTWQAWVKNHLERRREIARIAQRKYHQKQRELKLRNAKLS